MNVLCLDIRLVKSRQIICASCGNKLKVESGHIFSHPLLELLQCEVKLIYFEAKIIYNKERLFILFTYMYVYLSYNITFSFCQTCQKQFKDIDKAHDKNICYICGHHKKLYICSDKKCPSAFCKVIIIVEI